MAQDASGLIYCEACGVVNETATALLADAHQHIDGLERDLRSKRATISRLENSKADRLQGSKNVEKARQVLLHWQATCAPKAKEIESEDRLGNVLARLAGGFTVDELKLCADGYAKRPYVVNGKRSANGKPTERHVDAELIYRDPKRVQAGIALAEAPAVTVADLGDWQRIDWRKVRRANHREIIRALTEMYGKPAVEDGILTPAVRTTCPRCDGTLLVYEPDDAGASMLRCSCGLDEAMFFRALREDEPIVAMLTGKAA